MKQDYKGLWKALMLITLLLVSGLFLTRFITKAVSEGAVGDNHLEKAVPPLEAPMTTVTEGPAATPENGERLEIDHPLPLEPVAVAVPMASAHFGMWEYACDCGGYCDGFPEAMDALLLEKVEALRCAVGAPIIITSGVRCPKRNEEVGGIPGSWHLWGHAADLYSPEVPYTQVAAAARTLGLGVIEYPGQRFDHVEIWN